MALDLLGSLVVVVAASALAHHICLEQDRMSSFNFESFFWETRKYEGLSRDHDEVMMGREDTDRERDNKATQSQRSDIMSNVCFVCYLCVCPSIVSAPEKRQRVPSAYNRFIK